MDSERTRSILLENITLHNRILQDDDIVSSIIKIADFCCEALRSGKKIMICGNGGSAADAQHMAAELVGRFQVERQGLAAIALNTDTSILTAWANDYDFGTIFQRQVEALGVSGDVLIGISTSGNSENILNAFEYANQMEISTFAILGKDGGGIKQIVDKAIVIPSYSTARIQEVHITLIHIICELVENAMIENCDDE